MFAVVVIPNFALQAVLRHLSELRFKPAALVDPLLPKPHIVQLTAAARSLGVMEGLTASQAMARCGELIIRSRSIAQEEAATEVLLQTAYAFSPSLESTAPGVCTMDLKGLGLQFTDDSAGRWAGKVLDAFAQCGLEAQIGFAETPDLAFLAARVARPILTLQNAPETHTQLDLNLPFSPICNSQLAISNLQFPSPQRAALQSLPLAALDPPPEILEILRRWGIQTIGELLALGKDRIAERLGPQATELFDRVSARSVRPLQLALPPQEFAEQMEFEVEIETIEPLLFVLRRFVEQLARRLELIYLVIGELHLRLGLASGDCYERTLKIPAATGNIDTLFRMLHTHLETVRTDSPIASLRLVARPCRAESQQFGLFETTLRNPNQFAETLGRLTALCGSDRVGSPQLEPTHRPDAFRVGQTFLLSRSIGSDFPAARQSAAAARRRPVARLSVTERLQATGNIGLESPMNRQTGMSALPLRRFRPVLPASIEFRGQRPVLFRSSIFTGAIAEARGPFLSSGDWWKQDRWTREEWDVQTDDGALYRIYRSNTGCFVEGVYD